MATPRRKKSDKQQGVFLLTFHPHQFARMRVACPSRKSLLILTGRQDLFLVPADHPIPTDLRIEMDVHYVFVNDNFILRQCFDQPAESRATAFVFGVWAMDT